MNKYLHTVASVGFVFTLNYDARNLELKKMISTKLQHSVASSWFPSPRSYYDAGKTYNKFRFVVVGMHHAVDWLFLH